MALIFCIDLTYSYGRKNDKTFGQLFEKVAIFEQLFKKFWATLREILSNCSRNFGQLFEKF